MTEQDVLADVKARISAAQQRAALAVNTEMLHVYWQIGRGFSRTNLDYMRAFSEAWPTEAISQQAVGKLPWGLGEIET